MLERRDFLLAPRGADRDREVASRVQPPATALIAGLQAAGAAGVRAAKGGSPVAYGSLRSALCILIRRGCDVNSLIRRGTKTRAGQKYLDRHPLDEARCRLCSLLVEQCRPVLEQADGAGFDAGWGHRQDALAVRGYVEERGRRVQ